MNEQPIINLQAILNGVDQKPLDQYTYLSSENCNVFNEDTFESTSLELIHIKVPSPFRVARPQLDDILKAGNSEYQAFLENQLQEISSLSMDAFQEKTSTVDSDDEQIREFYFNLIDAKEKKLKSFFEFATPGSVYGKFSSDLEDTDLAIILDIHFPDKPSALDDFFYSEVEYFSGKLKSHSYCPMIDFVDWFDTPLLSAKTQSDVSNGIDHFLSVHDLFHAQVHRNFIVGSFDGVPTRNLEINGELKTGVLLDSFWLGQELQTLAENFPNFEGNRVNLILNSLSHCASFLNEDE